MCVIFKEIFEAMLFIIAPSRFIHGNKQNVFSLCVTLYVIIPVSLSKDLPNSAISETLSPR